MSIIAIYKTAAAIVLGEAFAHYKVLSNGALMFGARGAYEKGQFVVIKGEQAYYTNPFGDDEDQDITEYFNSVAEHLKDADETEGDDAVKKFIETNVELGTAGFVGCFDMLTEQHVIATILWQKLIEMGHSYEEVKELAFDAWGIGVDSHLPHARTDLDVIQAVAAFTGYKELTRA